MPSTDRIPNHFRSEANIDQIPSKHIGQVSIQDSLTISLARHTGVLTIPETGDWTIYSNADDGVMIWIDDALVINNSIT